jgi:hypothetical protein
MRLLGLRAIIGHCSIKVYAIFLQSITHCFGAFWMYSTLLLCLLYVILALSILVSPNQIVHFAAAVAARSLRTCPPLGLDEDSGPGSSEAAAVVLLYERVADAADAVIATVL